MSIGRSFLQARREVPRELSTVPIPQKLFVKHSFAKFPTFIQILQITPWRETTSTPHTSWVE